MANPANVLARLIAALTDEEGRITIPHFYDTVRELTPAEREAFGKAPFCEAAYRKGLGIRSTQGETGYTTMERTGIRPSLDVNGIWSGYTGEGTKTVIPVESLRENLDAAGARPGLPANRPAVRRVHAGARTCGVSVNVRALHGGYPYLTPTDLPAYRQQPQPSRRLSAKSRCPIIQAAASQSSAHLKKYWALNRYCSASALTKMRSILPMRAMPSKISTGASIRSPAFTVISPQS